MVPNLNANQASIPVGMHGQIPLPSSTDDKTIKAAINLAVNAAVQATNASIPRGSLSYKIVGNTVVFEMAN